MERIFNTGAPGPLAGIDPVTDEPLDGYDYTVKALIYDAVSYEESDLAPARETAQRYYYGLEPSLDGKPEEPLFGDPPVANDADANRSAVVSTDVKDTVLSILPSLMRIFGGTEHALEYLPTSTDSDAMATQATDYVRNLLWSKNDGFNLFYGTFKDALTVRVGIVTWWTDNNKEITEKTFAKLTRDQLGQLFAEAEDLEPEIVNHGPVSVIDGEEMITDVTVRYTKAVPRTVVNGVPPEEFRISRNAKSVKDADLVGHECFVRVSELVEDGFDFDFIRSKAGQYSGYSEEKFLRNPGYDDAVSLHDYVRYGSFYIRADRDGDGINELRHIVTVGEDYEVVRDEVADRARFAVFTPDPTPHVLVGDSAADMVMDIQRINTQLLRAGLDSLSQSIFPRIAYNILAVDTDDILNDDVGAPIRVRGNPGENMLPIASPAVGQTAFDAKMQMDAIRQQRTGISEASKGLDPRALQSTNIVGVEAVLTGAQERIELIALVFAHGGMKQLYEGLLQEIVDNAPNRNEIIKLRGDWVSMNPSLFDASMAVEVNPALGKGSDQARLSALMGIQQMQMTVVEKFGMGNGVVGPQELRNTIVDIMHLNNIRNDTRYFRQLTPEMVQAIESAPQEPTPEMVVAKSTIEEVRSKTAIALGKQKQEAEKLQQQAEEKAADRDLKRDQTEIDAFVRLTEIASNGILEQAAAEAAVEASVTPRNVDD